MCWKLEFVRLLNFMKVMILNLLNDDFGNVLCQTLLLKQAKLLLMLVYNFLHYEIFHFEKPSSHWNVIKANTF